MIITLKEGRGRKNFPFSEKFFKFFLNNFQGNNMNGGGDRRSKEFREFQPYNNKVEMWGTHTTYILKRLELVRANLSRRTAELRQAIERRQAKLVQ